MKKYYYTIITAICCFINLLNAQDCDYISDNNFNKNTSFISCNTNLVNGCLQLNSNFPILIDTDTYNPIEKINYKTVGKFNEGIPLKIIDDDKFVKKINLNSVNGFPFLFSFYGNIQQNLSISTNGFISFYNDIEEDDYSNPFINNQKIPSNNLPPLSIFGVYHDLEFNHTNNSDIYINIIGEYPCRKLVINFYNGNISGSTVKSTFQIVLHEQSNIIEINIENKSLPTESVRFKESVIGITDKNFNGLSYNERNTAIWEAKEESYLITPNGKELTPNEFSWVDKTTNNKISTTKNFSICNFSNTIYEGSAKYTNKFGEEFFIKEEHIVKIDEGFPLVKNYSESFCNPSQDLRQDMFYSAINLQENISLFNYKFYLNEQDAINNLNNFLPFNDKLTDNLYFVRVENKDDPNCFKIAKLDLKLTLTESTKQVDICESYQLLNEKFTLSNLNCQVFNNVNNVTNIKYYVNGVETTSEYINPNSKIKVEFNLGGCNSKITQNLTINFTKAPSLINKEISFESIDKIFDYITEQNQAEEEPFNWVEELKKLNYTFSRDSNITNIYVYKTLKDAVNNTNKINAIYNGSSNKDYKYELYLRIENNNNNCNGNCFNIIKINARVKFRKILTNIVDYNNPNNINPKDPYNSHHAYIYLCRGNGNKNSSTFLQNVMDDAHRVIKITNYNLKDLDINIYTSNQNAINNFNPITEFNREISENTVYHIKYTIKGTNDYIIIRLQYTFLSNKLLKNLVEICTDFTVNEQTINLSNNQEIESFLSRNILVDNYILRLNPKTKISFYKDPKGLVPINQIKVTNEITTVWVKIEFTQTTNSCSYLNKLDLKLKTIDNIKTKEQIINITCDNNNDKKEIVNLHSYLDAFIDDKTGINFKFYRNYNATNSTFSNEISANDAYKLSIDKSTTIYVRVSKNNICDQMVKLIINFTPEIHQQIILKTDETYLLYCNQDYLEEVSFNLNNAISELYDEIKNPPINEFITNINFYENYEDALNNNDNSINNPEDYILKRSIGTKTVYVRFNSIYGCYYIATVQVKFIELIKLKNNISLDLCADDLSGLYKVNIREWINNRTKYSNDTNKDLLTNPLANKYSTFKIYYNEKDFLNNKALTEEEEKNLILDPNVYKELIIGASLNGGCEDHIAIKIKYLLPNINNYTLEDICDFDNDGLETINLTIFESNYIESKFIYYPSLKDLNNNTNIISNPSNYLINNKNVEKIYFKVNKIQEDESCTSFGIIEVKLKPTIDFIINDVIKCPNETITIMPIFKTNQDNDILSFTWTNENGDIISKDKFADIINPGNYKLSIAHKNGCNTTKYFKVDDYEIPKVEKIDFTNNDAFVKALSNGKDNILYSIDNRTWQTSNIFRNLPEGVHTFYVKYDNNCNGISAKGLIPVIKNFISPNSDGSNDVWKINDINIFNGQEAELSIMDRHGKIIYTQKSNTALSWDGKLNNNIIPSDSYWYLIKLPDGRSFSGSILLKNKK